MNEQPNIPPLAALKYPMWICIKCGTIYGKRAPRLATWHYDKCDVCGVTTSVTEPRDFGYLNPGWDDAREVKS